MQTNTAVKKEASPYTTLISSLIYDLLGTSDLRISVLEPDGNEISEQGKPDLICRRAMSDPGIYSACLRCSAQGVAMAKKLGRPYTFRCHMGLAVTALPLMQDDVCRGFITLNGYCMEPEAMERLPIYYDKTLRNADPVPVRIPEDAGCFFPEIKVRAIIQTFSSMIACMNGLNTNARTLMNLQEIGASQLTGPQDLRAHAGDESGRIIQEAIRIVDEHLSENLSLERMARDLYVSTTYFCRLFRAKTGMKFSDYLAQQRIGRAKLLLATTELPISSIAQQVGYREANSFSRLFRSHTGITPSQYRKSCRI